MSYGVYTTAIEPELYRPTRGAHFYGKDFLNTPYFDATASRFLRAPNVFALGDESVNALQEAFGAVLRKLQRASLVPIEEARSFAAGMDKSQLKDEYITTLAAAEIIQIVRSSVDALLQELSPFFSEAQRESEQYGKFISGKLRADSEPPAQITHRIRKMRKRRVDMFGETPLMHDHAKNLLIALGGQ